MADWQNNLRSHNTTYSHRFGTSNNFNSSYHPSRSRTTDATDRYRSTASPTLSTTASRTHAHTTYTPDKKDYYGNTLSPTSYEDKDRQRSSSPLTDTFSKLGIQDKNERANSPMMAWKEEVEEDPRTEIRKACDVLRQIQKIDLDAMERKYRSLMESVEPTVLTKEELYTKSNDTSKTKSSSNETEERLRRERNELRSKVTELQSQVEEERGRLEKAKREIEDLRMKLLEEEEKVIKRKSGFEDEISKFNEKEKELENKNTELVEQLNSMKEMVRRIEKAKKDAEREKTDALTRLSKEMGAKLNERNPNIADLSDSNRPTKLAEKYSELYDNEWTDALEQLNLTMDEEAAIKVLLQIMQSSYHFCKDASSNQIRNVESALSSLSEDKWRDSTSIVSSSVTKLIKECQKEMKIETKDALYDGYMKSSASSRFANKIPEYVKKCLSLCWNMLIQDPQVIFGKPAEAGDAFDSNTYKEYTKTGSTVSYTVWMPMILYENGPILCKGTAQPIPSKVPQRAKSAYGRGTARRENDVDTSSSHRPVSAATVYTSQQNDRPKETVVDAFFHSDPRKNVTSKQRETRATAETMGVSKDATITSPSYGSTYQQTSSNKGHTWLGTPAEYLRAQYGIGPNRVKSQHGYQTYIFYDGMLYTEREWDILNQVHY